MSISGKTKGYRFTDRGGRVYINGKVYRPAFLRIDIDRFEAFEIAMTLLKFYRDSEREDEPQTVQLCRFGTIERDEEDDLEWPNEIKETNP